MGRGSASPDSSKASKALDRAEDPRETSILLRKATGAAAEGPTGRGGRRHEPQAHRTATSGPSQKESTLEEQARAAWRRVEWISPARPDSLRGLHEQIADLQGQLAQLQQQEEKTHRRRTAPSKVESFRTQRPSRRPTWRRSDHQDQRGFRGYLRRARDVGMAVQRAEDKTAEMARAGAIDELMATEPSRTRWAWARTRSPPNSSRWPAGRGRINTGGDEERTRFGREQAGNRAIGPTRSVPHVLLVHGGGHGAWCWADVQRYLRNEGVDSIADLPGRVRSNAAAILTNDYMAACIGFIDAIETTSSWWGTLLLA